MNRPKDPIELQAMEAWDRMKKSDPDLPRQFPITIFMEGYKAAIKANNETPKQ